MFEPVVVDDTCAAEPARQFSAGSTARSGTDGPTVSEGVTWEPCPNCERSAAVRWLDSNPVESDCLTGCRLSQSRTASTSSRWSLPGFPRRPPVPDAVSAFGHDALVTCARDLAHRLLGSMGRRWSHTQGVARRAASVAASVPDEHRPALVAAAWLHDIGYAEPLERCSFHPLDGAYHLQETAWGAPVAGYVAHHSGARFVAALRGLSGLMQQFTVEKYAIGPLADALTYADQTTGPDGRPMVLEDRFTDMLDRHGPHSLQARVHAARAPAIRAAVRRTEQRLLAARTSIQSGAAQRS